jgi:hypothetical protein
MPSSTSDPVSLTPPEPLRPVGGAAVDAAAPELVWSEIPEATEYRVQIGRDTQFDAPLLDMPVEPDAPAVSVQEGAPMNGSTCYWRVQAETPDGPTGWSRVAHFTGSAEPADAEPPTPLQPVSGGPVDGEAAVFTWSPPRQAADYELQVATNPDFEAPLVGLPVEPSTSLTLYDVLPQDGSTLYWRIRAQRRDDAFTPWSDPVPFTATTDAQVRSHEADQAPDEEQLAARRRTQAVSSPAGAETEAQAAAQAATEADAEGEPVRASFTSRAETLTWAAITLVSFVITLFLIVRALP